MADDAMIGFPEATNEAWAPRWRPSACRGSSPLPSRWRCSSPERICQPEEAHRIGLVNRIVPRDQVMTTARELAARIAENAPVTVRFQKEKSIVVSKCRSRWR